MTASTNAAPTSARRVHALIVDAGPLIKGQHQRIAQLADKFYTVADVMKELRDSQTREWLATLPFELVVRAPSDEAMAAVVAFAKKTGDFSSLSVADLRIMALTWMIEKETNGVEHLRKEPIRAALSVGGKKVVPAAPPSGQAAAAPAAPPAGEPQASAQAAEAQAAEGQASEQKGDLRESAVADAHSHFDDAQDDGGAFEDAEDGENDEDGANGSEDASGDEEDEDDDDDEAIDAADAKEAEPDAATASVPEAEPATQIQAAGKAAEDDDDDGGGWITPKNVTKHKARDMYGVTPASAKEGMPAVACMTSDFAMQNVMMQMNLKVMSVDGVVIRKLKTWVLRCHACYKSTNDMTKRFCPSCGNNTLLRTSVGIDANGQITYFLKKNFQYNLRGTRYSIPQAKGGRAANDLVLREDQREHQKALKEKQRRDKKLLSQDVFDADSSLLGGSSLLSKAGTPIIGYGRRNVNEVRGGRRRK
ncbi:20S-pre-rRNA D-site endonuclease nob1 [Polyrhizophydium stewartii]|uniref:20S-pre-rRNA D-site endonuclease NOB1 n=1 Tax=Polyrhizophydium stewartii TaxID=2732419 RepID=A0ABR4N7I3_9FUNG|nr:Nin1 binding protein [Polyrhizophydium stewartii]